MNEVHNFFRTCPESARAKRARQCRYKTDFVSDLYDCHTACTRMGVRCLSHLGVHNLGSGAAGTETQRRCLFEVSNN